MVLFLLDLIKILLKVTYVLGTNFLHTRSKSTPKVGRIPFVRQTQIINQLTNHTEIELGPRMSDLP
jgi:hypothetical protein